MDKKYIIKNRIHEINEELKALKSWMPYEKRWRFEHKAKIRRLEEDLKTLKQELEARN